MICFIILASLAESRPLSLYNEGDDSDIIDYSKMPIVPMSLFVFGPVQPGMPNYGDLIDQSKKDMIKALKEEQKKVPKDSEEYKQLDYSIKSIEAVLSVIQSDLASDISKVDKNTDLLLVQNSQNKEEDALDFGKLSGKMRVVVVGMDMPSSIFTLNHILKAIIKSRLSNDELSLIRFTKALNENNKMPKYDLKETDVSPNTFINGNCQDKILSLTLYGCITKFVGSECNANLIISGGFISDAGKGINSDSVMVFGNVDNTIPPTFFPLKSIYVACMEFPLCGIKYYDTYATLMTPISDGTGNCNEHDGYSVEYNYSKVQYGFVGIFYQIELNADIQCKSIYNCNISIQQQQITTDLPFGGEAKSLEDGKITVSKTGNWENVKTPKLIIEAEDPNMIDIPETIQKEISIEKSQVYVYVPKPVKKGLSVGAIVGIAIACVVVVGVIIGVCVYFFVIKKKKDSSGEAK